MLEINRLDFFLTYNSQTPVIICIQMGHQIPFNLFGVIALIGLGQCNAWF